MGMEIDEQGWPPSLFPEGKSVLPGLFWKESCSYSPSPGSGVNRAPTFYQWLGKLWLLIYIKKERKRIETNKTKIGQFWVLLDLLRFPLLCLLKHFSHTITTHWLCWSLLSNHAQSPAWNTFTLNYIFQRKSLILTSPRVLFHFDKDQGLELKQVISHWGFQPLIQGRHTKGCAIRSSLCLWSKLQGWLEKR